MTQIVFRLNYRQTVTCFLTAFFFDDGYGDKEKNSNSKLHSNNDKEFDFDILCTLINLLSFITLVMRSFKT